MWHNNTSNHEELALLEVSRVNNYLVFALYYKVYMYFDQAT